MTMAEETDFLVCVTVLLAWKASTEGTLAVGSGKDRVVRDENVSLDVRQLLEVKTSRCD